MNSKLKECENCKGWDDERNKMRNKLRCMVDCDARRIHQTKIAIEYNRAVGGSPTEHGKVVLGIGDKDRV